MFKKILKTITAILITRLDILTETLKQFEQQTAINSWYLEVGQSIEEVSSKYFCTYEDAVIIYEEWANGLLSECRPSEEDLRDYANHYANPNLFRLWKAYREKSHSHLNECEFIN